MLRCAEHVVCNGGNKKQIQNLVGETHAKRFKRGWLGNFISVSVTCVVTIMYIWNLLQQRHFFFVG
jgi:hypothetical protein